MNEEKVTGPKSRRKSAGRPVSMKPTGNYFYLGLGVNKYKNISHLHNTIRDVKKVGEILETKYGFKKCSFLEDDDVGKEKIQDQIDDLYNNYHLSSDDKLIIYFSGHGDPSQPCWCFSDYDPEKSSKKNSFSAREILAVSQDIGCEVLIVEDICHGGGAIDKAKVWPKTSNSLSTIWLISSTHPDEVAYDGIPGENSPFAKALMKVLEDNENLSFELTHKKIVEEFKKEIQYYSLLTSIRAGETFVLEKKITTESFSYWDPSKHWKSTFQGEQDIDWKELSNFINYFPKNEYTKRAYEDLQKLKKNYKRSFIAAKMNFLNSLSSLFYNLQAVEHKDDLKNLVKSIQASIRSEKIEQLKIENREFRKLSLSLDLESLDLYEGVEWNYWIGKSPVTIELFQNFSLLENSNRDDENYNDDLMEDLKDKFGIKDKALINMGWPAVNVSWVEAARFANWLSIINKLTPYYKIINRRVIGKYNGSEGFRLPTGKEWEEIAQFLRKDTGGEELPGWFAENSNNELKEVGSFVQEGVFDFFGNVYEWCLDSVDFRQGDIFRLCKGGAFDIPFSEFSVESGNSFKEDYFDLSIGFRLIRSIK